MIIIKCIIIIVLQQQDQNLATISLAHAYVFFKSSRGCG